MAFSVQNSKTCSSEEDFMRFRLPISATSASLQRCQMSSRPQGQKSPMAPGACTCLALNGEVGHLHPDPLPGSSVCRVEDWCEASAAAPVAACSRASCRAIPEAASLAAAASGACKLRAQDEPPDGARPRDNAPDRDQPPCQRHSCCQRMPRLLREGAHYSTAEHCTGHL